MQPEYRNGVAIVEAHDPPEVVLTCLLDVESALDRAREHGHELVFIYGLGASVYAGARKAPEPYIRVEVGQKVMFHGGVYTIQKAPNDNLRLQRYVMAAVQAA